MKRISTLVFLLIITNGINAQVDLYPANPLHIYSTLHISSTGEAPGTKINFTCRAGASMDSKDILIIVDGVPLGFDKLNSLNPDDIESITILKDAAASAIYPCHAAQGIIIVVTKAASQRKFIIKDFLTGDFIPKATVCFTDGNNSFKAIANDSGVVIIDKLKGTIKYGITVSSAGYKTLFTTSERKEQEILLDRDVKECPNVVVSCQDCGTRRIACGGSLVEMVSETSAKARTVNKNIQTIYPNPVQRSRVFNLEFESGQSESVQLAVVSMTGNIVSLQSKKITKGVNRLSITADAKWAAGIYNIQLRNEKGTLIRQEKIVVQ